MRATLAHPRDVRSRRCASGRPYEPGRRGAHADCYGATACLSLAPAEKRGARPAGTSIGSPVCGWRPCRAPWSLTENLPKPVIATSPPAASSRSTPPAPPRSRRPRRRAPAWRPRLPDRRAHILFTGLTPHRVVGCPHARRAPGQTAVPPPAADVPRHRLAVGVWVVMEHKASLRPFALLAGRCARSRSLTSSTRVCRR